jgi:hypothetical protein
MESSGLSMITPGLISMSSVLIDASSRPERYEERIRTVVILWLTASLQQSSRNRDLVWSLVHLSFFCSILSCAYQAYIIRYRWSALNRTDFSLLLAPASVIPLVYSFTKTPSSVDESDFLLQCAIIFLVSFVGLCVWTWNSKRSQAIRDQLIGMPVVASPVHNFHTRPLNENKWHEWTTSEVLHWISTLDHGWRERVCGRLAPELIDGSVLDSLSLADLRFMRLTYGDARRLLDEIETLISKNPSRSRRGNFVSEQRTVDKTLDTAGWNMGDDSRFLMTPPVIEEDMLPPPLPPVSSVHPEMDDRMIQQAKTLMMEKYGMELPAFKMPEEINPPPIEPAPSHLSHLDLPPGFLEAMPPHIYQIASQKPDLIRKLIESRKRKDDSSDQELKPTAQWTPRQNDVPMDNEGRAPPAQLTPLQKIQLKNAAYSERLAGAQKAEDSQGAAAGEGLREPNVLHDEDMVDSEKTGLLRNRGSKYASIR